MHCLAFPQTQGCLRRCLTQWAHQLSIESSNLECSRPHQPCDLLEEPHSSQGMACPRQGLGRACRVHAGSFASLTTELRLKLPHNAGVPATQRTSGGADQGYLGILGHLHCQVQRCGRRSAGGMCGWYEFQMLSMATGPYSRCHKGHGIGESLPCTVHRMAVRAHPQAIHVHCVA